MAICGVLNALQRTFWGNRAHTVALRKRRGGSSVARGQRVDEDLTCYVEKRPPPRRGFIKFTRMLIESLEAEGVKLTATQVPLQSGDSLRGFADAVGTVGDQALLLEIKSGFGRGRKYDGKVKMEGPMEGVADSPYNRHWLQLLVYYEMMLRQPLPAQCWTRKTSACWLVTVSTSAGVTIDRKPPRWWTAERRKAVLTELGVPSQ
ncbi:MAG: hypothetical protein KDK08_29945 [Rhizobiaceae bacterium]|nr:hypothetical protein [Rhizobiaceae bacterium]